MFKRAIRQQIWGRIALVAPTGGGKTFTSLTVASEIALAFGGRFAVVDTEHGSAKKYADRFDFDVMELASFDPDRYIESIRTAEEANYKALVLDSLSHAWAGKDGLLEFVDKQAARDRSNNTFGAWRKATPKHNELIEAMLSAQLHLIVTMRAKMEYVQEKDEKTGKTTVRKIGLQPVQRDGLEYEFDIVGDLDQDNTLVISKTRCPDLFGAVIQRPGKMFAQTVLKWLTAGAAPSPAQKPAEPKPKKDGKVTADYMLISSAQRGLLIAIAKEQGIMQDKDTGPLKAHLSKILGRPIESSKDILASEFDELLRVMEGRPASGAEPEPKSEPADEPQQEEVF